MRKFEIRFRPRKGKYIILVKSKVLKFIPWVQSLYVLRNGFAPDHVIEGSHVFTYFDSKKEAIEYADKAKAWFESMDKLKNF